jgi:hypothetical protein
LWVAAAVLGLVIVTAALFLATEDVTMMPAGRGPAATALLGGGSQEAAGVALSLGSYNIRLDNQFYLDTLFKDLEKVCGADFNVPHEDSGKITQQVVQVAVQPTGERSCIESGQYHLFDDGKLKVALNEEGVLNLARKAEKDSPIVTLSRISAVVQKTNFEWFTSLGAVLGLALGPALLVAGWQGAVEIRGRRRDESDGRRADGKTTQNNNSSQRADVATGSNEAG